MRYLPDRLFADGSPSLIATCLSSVPLLLDREEAHSTIPELFAYADSQLDDHGNPLFPAADDKQRYLSLQYKSQDREILRFYGLQRVTTEDMILRVRVLANSKDWPGFVKNKDSSWHNRLSSWTSRVFGRDLTAGVLALLSLVPGGVDRALSNWNGSPGTIYFPEISGVPLPDGLPIVKLDPKACADRDNRALYASLGVSIADPVKIEEIILLHHSLWKPQGDKQSQIATSLGSLRFIYEMLQMGKLERTRDRDLVVFDRNCCPKRPKKEMIYLSSASWLGTGALASLSGQEGIADIESTLSFLHESYLRDSPRLLNNIKFKMTWVDFLLQVVGLHKGLRIFTRQSQDVAVSLPFLALAQRWPGRVLEWLYQVYREDPGRWNRKPDIKTALKKMQIVCTNGMGFPLSETILPLPSLLSTFPGLFGDLCKALPFLKLEKPLDKNDEELCSQWKLFAAHFGVIHADDIRLSLAALKTWMRKDARPGQISVTLAVVNIYDRIQRQQNAATAKFIRTWFDENPGLLCTPQLETKGRPVPPKWEYRQASDKVTMAMVAHAWVPVFNRLQPVHRANLMAFFRDTLGLEFDTNIDSSPNPPPSKSTVIPAPPSKSLKNIKVRLPPADAYVKSREKSDGKSAAEKQVKAGKTGSNASFPLRAESIFEFGKGKRTTFAFKGL
ncbi:uncharacterized protein QC761_0000490 [Podospora bellae-mahoneyi]|uniref:Uncharacterized protein n=1 Tax=Podospora bellae-mahoneyi TaxID=2093777 RepID=A0ABR0FTX2_9PEZI|nr:hypothetical protein QC761_0000490 [Podospora bellae-mahoneyi]